MIKAIHPGGVIRADIDGASRGARRWSDEPQFPGGLTGDGSCPLKPGQNGFCGKKKVGHALEIFLGRQETLPKIIDHRPVQIKQDPAGPLGFVRNGSLQRQTDSKVAPQPAKIRRRRQKPDIRSQGPQVARVVGKPFQFEGDGPDRLGPRRDLRFAQRLHEIAIGDGMSHHGVSGDGLSQKDGPIVRDVRHHDLDPTVLITELDFKIQDLLAQALKPEMSRLNDAGMNRPTAICASA